MTKAEKEIAKKIVKGMRNNAAKGETPFSYYNALVAYADRLEKLVRTGK